MYLYVLRDSTSVFPPPAAPPHPTPSTIAHTRTRTNTRSPLRAPLNLSVASFPSAVRPPYIFMTFPPRQIRPRYLESRLAPIHVIQHESSPRNQPGTLFHPPPPSLFFLTENVTLNILAGAMQLVLRLTIAAEEGGVQTEKKKKRKRSCLFPSDPLAVSPLVTRWFARLAACPPEDAAAAAATATTPPLPARPSSSA